MRAIAFIAFGLLAAVSSASDPPVAWIYDNPARTITVAGERVDVDIAKTVAAWEGKTYPQSYAERQRIKDLYRDWLSYEVDFLVSFDRPVAAGSVTLFGEIDSDNIIIVISGYDRVWIPVELDAMAAGSRIRLIRKMIGSSITVTYGETLTGFLDVIRLFHCAALNSSTRNLGATVTVEACLFEHGSDVPIATIGRFSHRFDDVQPQFNWFNAYVSRYRSIPDDEEFFPVGGRWRTAGGADVGDLLRVESPGVVEIDSDMLEYPEFVSTRRNPVPIDKKEAVAEIEFNPFTEESCPRLKAGESGLCTVSDGSSTNFCVVAEQGGTNVLKRADLAETVETTGFHSVKVEEACFGGKTFVRYSVDGVVARVDGADWIPTTVVNSGEMKVSFRGSGRLRALSGSCESSIGGIEMICR